MRFPASTCSPPKRFTTRRLECESRPFLVLAPGFLCAMTKGVLRKFKCSAGADVRDLHLSEQLSVILLPQVMRAALELDDRHLGALAVAHDGGEHLAPLEGRLAELDVRALPDQQHFAELDRGARLGVELLDAQHAILRHPLLLAARGG